LHSRQAAESENLTDDMKKESVIVRTTPQKIFSYTLAFLIGISALLGSISVIIVPVVPVALIALTIASIVCLVRRKNKKAHEQ